MTFCSWTHTVSKNPSCTQTDRKHRQSHLQGAFILTISFIALTLKETITVTVDKLLPRRGTMTLLIADWSGFYSAAAGVYVWMFWQGRANFISICLVVFILCTGCHRITLACWSVCFCAGGMSAEQSTVVLTMLPLQYFTVYWLRPFQFSNRPQMLKHFCGNNDSRLYQQ